MTALIGRREFITLLGGAAAWPLAARAEQPTMPVIGFLHNLPLNTFTDLLRAFRQSLGEAGYVEGKNLTIEYRSSEGQDQDLPDLAADLIRRQVRVIATPGSAPAALAAKAATATIPIVFGTALDPVKLGLVESINRPGGNATGVNSLIAELGAKRLALLLELVPRAEHIAVLVNPTDATRAEIAVRDVEAAAGALRLKVKVLTASTSREVDEGFATLARERADALFVVPDPLYFSKRVQLAVLAAYYKIPSIYAVRDHVDAGGLMSYGTSLADMFRQAGTYTARILKGANPADLPVVQSAKFEFVINLHTAKTLGLEVPSTLLARADEVIE
jgi:putative ABC transport system substrate-binding protein